MPTINQYFNLIQHNTKLLDLVTCNQVDHLLDEDFSDWQLTVIFYIACIYLKSSCFIIGIDVQDHASMRNILNTNKDLRSFWPVIKFYRHIEEASRDARYEGRKFTKEEFINKYIPKFNKVRDVAVNFIQKKNVSNVPVAEIEKFFKR